MRNRDNNRGVVEDMWINTSAGVDAEAGAGAGVVVVVDTADHPVGHARRSRTRPAASQRPGHAFPAVPETATDWNDLEQENALLNPDPAILDRG